MFYSDSILTKKGALAKVWLAAHMESKLTKVQVGSVDVGQAVKDILKNEEEPIALRVSGQLLLGVCRIYSRKAKYLLDDCNDALVNIKMQIRPALVDLPEDQLAAPNNDINMDEADNYGLELDWDLGIPDFQPSDLYVARAGDISLADAHFELDLDFGGRNEFDVGPADGFQSQDFDLGLDLGLDDDDDDHEGDETVSAVEFGRDAAPAREARLSMGSRFGAGGEHDMSILGDRSMDQGGGMDLDAFAQGEMDYQPMDVDLGLDLGLDDNADPYADMGGAGFDFGADGGHLPELDPSGERRESRESSRLSTPPADAGLSINESSIANLTPRTAAQISALAGKQSALASSAIKKKKTVRVIIDETTELSGDRNISASQSNRQNRDLSAILTPQRFIPSSRNVIRLMAIRADPLAHYQPTRTAAKGGEELLYAGPPGLGPELASMFLLPLGMLRRRREAHAGGDEEEEQQRKRARIEAGEEDDDEVESGRRESRALSLGLGGSSRAGGDHDDLAFGGGDDFFGAGGDVAFPMDDNDNFDMGDVQPYDDNDLELNEDGTPKAKKARSRRPRRDGRDGSEDADDDDNLSRREGSLAPSNAMLEGVGADAYDEHNGSVAGSMAPATGGGPLDIFDSRPRKADGGAASSQDESQRSRRSGSHASHSRSGSIGARSASRGLEEESQATGAEQQQGGRPRQHVSRNTARAMGVLRRELGEDKQPELVEEGAEPVPVEEKKISFAKISEKTTKRAAAAFFFELLVLGTKDCLKLEQEEAYADIEVRAKEKLWRGGPGVTA